MPERGRNRPRDQVTPPGVSARGELAGECPFMLHAPRIRALETRHAGIETRIASEGARPRPDDAALAKMKVEKLRIKEEMEKLRHVR